MIKTQSTLQEQADDSQLAMITHHLASQEEDGIAKASSGIAKEDGIAKVAALPRKVKLPTALPKMAASPEAAPKAASPKKVASPKNGVGDKCVVKFHLQYSDTAPHKGITSLPRS